MPMRAFRASKSFAGTHVKANLRLWTGVSGIPCASGRLNDTVRPGLC
jgi:hypothetical protein